MNNPTAATAGKVYERKTGSEPVFPWDVEDVSGNKLDRFSGLTKREYFAGLAMQGIVSAGGVEPERGFNAAGMQLSHLGIDCVAKEAVRYADALLMELAKETK